MRLSKLDSLQHDLIRENPDTEHGCHDCVYSDLDNGGIECQHPLNSKIQDVRAFFGIPSLVLNHLKENNLDDPDNFDFNVGSYCLEHEYYEYPEDEYESPFIDYK